MDIDIPQLKALIGALVDGGVSDFEFEDDKVRLRIQRGSGREVVVTSASAPMLTSLVPVGHAQAEGPASVPPLSISPQQASATVPAAAPAADDGVFVTSPFVGTFYRQASPDAPAFVDVGSKIREGQTLCIIEAMKLMNELEADSAGTILEILAENGKPVEFGQKLFKIKPA